MKIRMYKIELAKKEDLNVFHEIIISRCKWLTDKDLNQWKIDSYPVRYNIDYFEEQLYENKLFVAKKEGSVCGGFLLKEHDEKYWSDSNKVNAYYIHHLATKIGEKGLGKIIIEFSKEEAKKNNKDYLRLDCVSHNKKLNEYYQKLGFKYMGCIQIKNGSENLWQIKL